MSKAVITLNKIPKPDLKRSCQELMSFRDAESGWLRRKHPFKIKFIENLLSSISWDRKFIVLYAGCMYVYKSERETCPERAFSLFGYTQVLRAGEVKVSRDVPWTFKVVYVLDEKGKVHYFGAVNEAEMIRWMRNIKRQMILANNIDLSEDCLTDEDINDLETPISTTNYFASIKNIDDIKKDLDEDSDLESEYIYIDGEEGNQLKQKAEAAKKISSSSCPPSQYDVGTLLANRKLPEPPSSEFISYGRSPAKNRPLPSPPGPRLPSPPGPRLPSPPGPAVQSKPVVKQLSEQLKMKVNIPPLPPSKNKVPRPPVETPPSPTPVENTKKSKKPPPPPMRPGKTTSGGTVGNDDSDETRRKSDARFHCAADVTVAAAYTIEELLEDSAKEQPLKVIQATRSRAGKPPRSVPAVPSKKIVDLEKAAKWDGDQGEGQRFMISLEEEGAYMIRAGATGSESSTQTLLVIAEHQLRKYRIHQSEEKMYSLQSKFNVQFDSIHNLLNYYRNNSLPNRTTMLTKPYSDFC